MDLEIPLSEHFALSAGRVVARGSLRIIHPLSSLCSINYVPGSINARHQR
jgi:hypothetical protein